MDRRLKLLIDFIGWSSIDANKHEPLLANSYDETENDFLPLVYNDNLEYKNLGGYLQYFVRDLQQQLVSKVISIGDGVVAYRYSKKVDPIIDTLDAFGVNWMCAYLVNKKLYFKYVNTDKGVDKRYVQRLESFLLKIANNMNKHDIKAMQDLLANNHKKLIQQIHIYANEYNMIENHPYKIKLPILWKKIKAGLRFKKYHLTDHEKRLVHDQKAFENQDL